MTEDLGINIVSPRMLKLQRLISTSNEALLDNEIDNILRKAILAAVEAEIEKEKQSLNT